MHTGPLGHLRLCGTTGVQLFLSLQMAASRLTPAPSVSASRICDVVHLPKHQARGSSKDTKHGDSYHAGGSGERGAPSLVRAARGAAALSPFC